MFFFAVVVDDDTLLGLVGVGVRDAGFGALDARVGGRGGRGAGFAPFSRGRCEVGQSLQEAKKGMCVCGKETLGRFGQVVFKKGRRGGTLPSSFSSASSSSSSSSPSSSSSSSSSPSTSDSSYLHSKGVLADALTNHNHRPCHPRRRSCEQRSGAADLCDRSLPAVARNCCRIAAKQLVVVGSTAEPSLSTTGAVWNYNQDKT